MSASKVSRIERGFLSGVPVDDLVRVVHVLDARLELDIRWRGALVDRLLDERHAALVDSTVRWLTAEGWTTIVEASFSIRGERGSIDVFGLHPSRALVVAEVKASIGDANQTLIGVDRKGRLAPLIARERGWPVGPVSRLLVVGESTTSRDRIRRHEAAFRSALPAGTSACRAWIRAPTSEPIAGIVFLSPTPVTATNRRSQ